MQGIDLRLLILKFSAHFISALLSIVLQLVFNLKNFFGENYSKTVCEFSWYSIKQIFIS